MCGLVGFISKNNNNDRLELATNAMRHRGPDDFGFYRSEKISLGHRRLSIQDLSENGHQPMISSDDRYVIVFNGEIYNHSELREKRLKDVAFKGHSDTETLLYGLIRYGIDFAGELNGIFAFAFYDTLSGELIVCRDQFGVKPLYYYQKASEFYFASELKSLLLLGIDKSLDYASISNYLHYLYSPGERTPFLNVRKLFAGHYLSCNVNNPESITIKKYYEIPFQGEYQHKSLNDYIEQLDKKLEDAVKRQMLSDVPVGFFLSGGLDSTAIVAMARKAFPDKPMSCYTIDTGGGFDGFADDLYYAKKAAKHLNVDLHIVKADIDIVNSFDEMVWHLDEPQADAAPLNVQNICRAARQNGDIVLLGGAAGDDIFSGYRRHQALTYEPILRSIPKSLWKLTGNGLSRFNSSAVAIRRLKKIMGEAAKQPLERLAGYYGWLQEEKVFQLFSALVAPSLKDYHFSDLFLKSLENISEERNDLNRMLYWEMKYFLADHNLNYTDKMSMAESIEVRVPFLDIDLVNFSTSLPPEFKMKGKEVKYILKKTMEKYLPKEIIYRPKTGFGAPVRQWITKDLDSMISERLSKDNLQKWNIFDPDAIHKLISDNKNGYIDASYSIWALLAIHSWLEQFCK